MTKKQNIKHKALRDYTAAHADVRQLIKRKKKRGKAVVSLHVVIDISMLKHRQARKDDARFYSKESDTRTAYPDSKRSLTHSSIFTHDSFTHSKVRKKCRGTHTV